jgi:hypothetical protein
MAQGGLHTTDPVALVIQGLAAQNTQAQAVMRTMDRGGPDIPIPAVMHMTAPVVQHMMALGGPAMQARVAHAIQDLAAQEKIAQALVSN